MDEFLKVLDKLKEPKLFGLVVVAMICLTVMFVSCCTLCSMGDKYRYQWLEERDKALHNNFWDEKEKPDVDTKEDHSASPWDTRP